MSQELADHLKFFADLGVDGVSRDPAWRTRALAPSTPVPGERPPSPESTPVPADRPRFSEENSVAVATPVPKGDPRPQSRPPSPPVGGAESTQILAVLKEEIGPACQRCKLHTLGRKQVVFGVGNPNADMMFVGEAPGADEDEQGEPFVGRAGQLLTKIIEAIGLQRSDVYIANIIKCRPPGNRNPDPDEVEQCEPFLFRQVEAVKPKVIVALGKFAAQSLLRTTDPITRLRGRSFNYRGATLIPTFHPAYLLRNPSAKREVWEDMKKVRGILQGHE
jgi:uracil-DNA glycosylase family 4